MLIKDISPDAQSYNVDASLFYVGGTRDTIIKDRKAIDLIVDEPCREACKYLFDCNVLTQNSSANRNDINAKTGYITIDYKSLSDENKKVYIDLHKRHIASDYNTVYFNDDKETGVIVAQPFTIEVPLNENTDSIDFSNLMLEIAKEFKPQEIMYGYYTRDEILNIAKSRLEMHMYKDDYIGTFYDYIMDNYGEEITEENFIKEYTEYLEYYHDEQNDRYWISEELCKKAKDNKKLKK